MSRVDFFAKSSRCLRKFYDASCKPEKARWEKLRDLRKMQLKNCPDCQHQVSPSARSCPNCGRVGPGGKAPMDSIWQVTVVGATIAGAFWFFGSITAAINSPTSQGAEELEQSARETAKAVRCASQPTSADCD